MEILNKIGNAIMAIYNGFIAIIDFLFYTLGEKIGKFGDKLPWNERLDWETTVIMTVLLSVVWMFIFWSGTKKWFGGFFSAISDTGPIGMGAITIIFAVIFFPAVAGGSSITWLLVIMTIMLLFKSVLPGFFTGLWEVILKLFGFTVKAGEIGGTISSGIGKGIKFGKKALSNDIEKGLYEAFLIGYKTFCRKEIAENGELDYTKSNFTDAMKELKEALHDKYREIGKNHTDADYFNKLNIHRNIDSAYEKFMEEISTETLKTRKSTKKIIQTMRQFG